MPTLTELQRKIPQKLIDADIIRYSFQLNSSEDIFRLLMIQRNWTPYQTYERLWQELVQKGRSVAPLLAKPDYEVE